MKRESGVAAAAPALPGSYGRRYSEWLMAG
jgi:hypothetical protein